MIVSMPLVILAIIIISNLNIYIGVKTGENLYSLSLRIKRELLTAHIKMYNFDKIDQWDTNSNP